MRDLTNARLRAPISQRVKSAPSVLTRLMTLPTRVSIFQSNAVTLGISGRTGWQWFDRTADLPAIRRVRARAANVLPETNRQTGPKERAAGAPRKCNPGKDASSPGPSTG